MSDDREEIPFPQNKDELVRDVTLIGRLKDIRDSAQLEDALSPKWWETAVSVTQFAAALGTLACLLHYSQLYEDLQLRILSFFMALLVLSLIAGFGFMLFKLHHLRQAYRISHRQVETLAQRVEALEKERAGAEPTRSSQT